VVRHQPQLEGLGGVYCANCDIAVAVPADSTELLGVRPWATSPELADRLWRLSEGLTGVVAMNYWPSNESPSGHE
jgi:hypothetical protein